MIIRFLFLILVIVLPMFTIRTAKTDFFVCEVDLLSAKGNEYYKPWTSSSLTDECRAVYAKKETDPNGFKLYADEANSFRDFVAAIEQYEMKKSGQKLCANGKYPVSIQDRNKFYKQVKLAECYKTNNKENFLQCLVQRRKELVSIIKDATDKL